ncbi:TonB-dependent receptor [Mucilaginibacter mali]|uniref:TonB-dependent receptor n=1 Tax=Mucilaginibacter mali TaxID=2740462 RepID=A0A7D4Q186_9SPHI|nr:TonB-dependent receptor [Mucilaginibacter mali]QKJ30406.1 TonB-dependent receptor [Mucilaginibacter mali]
MNKIYSILLLFLCLTVVVAKADGPLLKNGSIRGRVQTSDGKPAVFVSVGIKNTNKGTTTDDNGNYVLTNIKPGTYTVKVSSVGLQAEEKDVTVSEGKPTILDFILRESASQLSEVSVTGSNRRNKPVLVGKSGLRPLDVPQAIQVIDSTVIADQQINRLADVMKNVNGIALGENRGSVNESFYARGYSLGANNVFKNGARSSTGGMPEASTLESVEVLKGSAALMYGGVTGGAVVNMVTKKPKFNWGGEVSMRAGSYDMYKPTVDVYGPLSKNIAFRVITTKENANSFRDVVKTDRFYINPSLLFNISKKTELILQGDYLKSNYTPDFGIGTVAGQITPVGRNAFVNASWAYNNTNTGTAQANLTHRFNDTWKLNVIGSFQSYYRNYFGAERPQATAANGVAPRALTRSNSKEYTTNQQINLTGSAVTGAIKHTLLFGADADQSKTTAYAFKYGSAGATSFSYPNFNLLDPSTYATSMDIPYTYTYQNTQTPIYRMGAFAQDLISLTEQFKVLAGVRYTYQRTPKASTYNQETGVTTLANTGIAGNKVDKAFSPKVGLIYQPVTSTSFYLSYANNFTSNSGVDVNGSPMGSSIIDQYEAGVKREFLNGKLSVGVTAYRIMNNRFAQTAQFQADGVTPNSDTNVKEFSGKTASDGLELDINGKLSPNIYFLAGYAYNFFRYTQTLPTGITEGERIVGSTPHTANATVFYTFTNGDLSGLKFGLSGFYTGKRSSGFNTLKTGAARGVPVTLTDYATFDLSAGYTYKKVSLLAKVSNFTNEINYLVHENYSVNPIAPRMVQATLSYKF